MNDYPLEKLLVALRNLVPLRAALWGTLSQKDRRLLSLGIINTAKATMSFSLQRVDINRASRGEKIDQFVSCVQRAKTQQDIVDAFVAIKETCPYWEDKSLFGTGEIAATRR